MSAYTKAEFASRLLHDLEQLRTFDAAGTLSGFNSSGYSEATVLLEHCISWHPDVPQDEVQHILGEAIREVAQSNAMGREAFLQIVDRRERAYLSKRPQRFVLITGVSLPRQLALSNTRLRGVQISFPARLNAKSQSQRQDLIDHAQHSLFAPYPTDYRWVRASVHAKSAYAAAEQASDAIELLVALWNLGINRQLGIRYSAGRRDPVSSIHLAPVHTLHLPSGALAEEIWWFSPSYVGAQSLYRRDFSVPQEFAVAARRLLRRLQYAGRVEDAIRHYGRAAGEANWTSAYSLMWQALESATDTSRPGADTVRRASFLFEDAAYHARVLEDLRDCRNELVHQQRDPAALETRLHILKRYVESAIVFHLGHAGQFDSITEAGAFLDLPSDPKLLQKRLRLVNRAAKFRSP